MVGSHSFTPSYTGQARGYLAADAGLLEAVHPLVQEIVARLRFAPAEDVPPALVDLGHVPMPRRGEVAGVASDPGVVLVIVQHAMAEVLGLRLRFVVYLNIFEKMRENTRPPGRRNN